MMSMTGAGMQERMNEYQNALDDMSNEAVEYVRGIPVVKTFGQTVFSFKRFKGAIDNYEKWVISYTKELRLPMMFYTTCVNGVFAFLIAAAIYFTQDTVTDTFLLNLIFYIIITPIITITLTKIMFASENAMIVSDALARIDSILQMEPLKNAEKEVSLEDASLSLSDVTFSYDGRSDVLHSISLKIESGDTVAFVGPSGGGKTTLASLISRFFDVKSGKIQIGGVDIRDIPKEQLMDTISFVFQDSHLLKSSILENVCLAKPGASREEVLKALKSAQCMDIVEKLPDGIDTVIGAKGTYLSGGEQQRIAIARVMLKNSPIVILDEATAFADPDNEIMVQQAFSNLAQNKTVIMIAHRLSTIVHADKIFVLKEGRIAQRGDHQTLIQQPGTYQEMWNNYRSAAKWKVSKEVSS